VNARFERDVALHRSAGRPSIAHERLLRSLLLQIFHSARSERMLIEQSQYNLLFRRFVGMEMDETVWNHAVFSEILCLQKGATSETISQREK
jgi:transposase